MEKILIIGAGGHAKSVIDVVESTKKYKIIGLIDNNTKINNKKIGEITKFLALNFYKSII